MNMLMFDNKKLCKLIFDDICSTFFEDTEHQKNIDEHDCCEQTTNHHRNELHYSF